jgi:hypothetical protein
MIDTNENALNETLTQIGDDEIKQEKSIDRKIPFMFKDFIDKIFTQKFNEENEAILKDVNMKSLKLIELNLTLILLSLDLFDLILTAY